MRIGLHRQHEVEVLAGGEGPPLGQEHNGARVRIVSDCQQRLDELALLERIEPVEQVCARA